MSTPFTIDVDWPRDGFDQSMDTTEMSIWVDGQCATEVQEIFEGGRRRFVRLSAVRLAEWLASNWWRLRWEPASSDSSDADSLSDWNMSHNMASIGSGYVWPWMSLCSDGDNIIVQAKRTAIDLAEPIRYLAQFTKLITNEDFERGVDEFVYATIDRLSWADRSETELPRLWELVNRERQDPAASEMRQMEAYLGYDPEEAPDDLLERLTERGQQYGISAVRDLAVHSKARTLVHLDEWAEQIDRTGADIEVPRREVFRQKFEQSGGHLWVAWQRGERAAQLARDLWDIAPGPILNNSLSELLRTNYLLSSHSGESPISAGLRDDRDSDYFRVSLRQRSQAGRRFALSRLVADHLAPEWGDPLLPATDAKTSRQQFQRAFAREFLCPFDDLQEYLGNKWPVQDDIEDAAEHFQVSVWAIRNTLVNKGVLGDHALIEAADDT